MSDEIQLAVPVPVAARSIGIGRTVAFAEVKAGRLKSFLVGKRRLVAISAIHEYIADRMAETELQRSA